MSNPPATASPPIIFYDGLCAMCNGFVRLVLRFDRRHIFRFAPLRGETAKRMLPPLPDDPRQWSVIYVDEKGLHDQSDASLRIYQRLGGVFKLLSLFLLVPRIIRDPLYRLLAVNRYRVFGKHDACPMPPRDQVNRFLP